jgi:hypothetical protein
LRPWVPIPPRFGTSTTRPNRFRSIFTRTANYGREAAGSFARTNFIAYPMGR